MITLYNRTDQYEKSMNLLKTQKNDSWKKKMHNILERKIQSGVGLSKKVTGFFPITPVASRSKPVRDLKVACILDRFSFDSLSHEMNLHPTPKHNWKEFLREGEFDFFLAESIWKGHDEQWIWAIILISEM